MCGELLYCFGDTTHYTDLSACNFRRDFLARATDTVELFPQAISRPLLLRVPFTQILTALFAALATLFLTHDDLLY